MEKKRDSDEFVLKKEILNLCEQLIDQITTAKGFLDLNDERDNYFTKATRREILRMEDKLKEFINKILERERG